jgi:hypothetical protein
VRPGIDLNWTTFCFQPKADWSITCVITCSKHFAASKNLLVLPSYNKLLNYINKFSQIFPIANEVIDTKVND